MYKIDINLKNNISSLTISENDLKTTALCTVEGPIHSRNENFDFLTVDVKWRSQDPKQGKYFSNILKSILEHFILRELDLCRSICISIYVTGSPKFTFLSGVNVALIGLINTGIPLKGMFYGIQNGDKVEIYDKNEKVFEHFLKDGNEYGEGEDVNDLLRYTKEVINFNITQQHTIS
ncbi:rnase ph [Nosema bombycis CQ1]|uniref:Rnase ph n=1 Tax=Nosema bombycis (strain CQ1 / CVCC 102059) TaxID=578461 RepID=R0MDN6_NOSB1|nr:rnase ph [Nosema bombycis CQ1]|eukprot:EOB12195.1 rnase ph [Nosema bombycis CQ1]